MSSRPAFARKSPWPVAGSGPAAIDPLFPDPVSIQHPPLLRGPVVLASPHSGRDYPPAFLAASRLDALAIRRSEDSFIDELLGPAQALGLPLLAARFPRAYLDVNREPFELDPAMFADPLPAHANTRSLRVSAGLGTIARVVREGAEIYRHKLSVAEAERRIGALYVPYHARLLDLLEASQAQFGCAILLDMHSMPAIGGAGERDSGAQRADIVLGDRFGTACAAAVVGTAERVLTDLGLKVQRNHPYAGGFATEHYGRPRQGMHALQIEVNRSLYMNEDRIERLPSGMAAVARALEMVTAAILALPPEGLRAR